MVHQSDKVVMAKHTRPKFNFDDELRIACEVMKECHLTADEYRQTMYDDIDSRFPRTLETKSIRDAMKSMYRELAAWMRDCGYLDEQGYLLDE